MSEYATEAVAAIGREAAREGRTRDGRLEKALLVLFATFTGVALLGYATLGRNPGWLVALPDVIARSYAITFSFFAQAQVWLAGAVLLLVLGVRARLRWVPAFVAVYGLSLVSELLGTGIGQPFGAYRYAEALGPAWQGRVPVIIPLSWFCMALPSWAVAQRAPVVRGAVGRVLVASLILLVWDLSLDPAMSHATRYWTWSDTGPYYGMPWQNLFGWYITGIALMAVFEATRSARWVHAIPLRFLILFYLVNLALPLGMNAAAGLWLAVVATLLVAGLVALWWRAAAAAVAPDRGRETVVAQVEAT